MLRPRNVLSIGALSLVALGATGCSRRRSSSQIVSNVQNNILSDGRMQMARVQVVATNGVVTLSGYVTSDEQRNATMQDASRVEGVRTVVDNLADYRRQPSESDHHRAKAVGCDRAGSKPLRQSRWCPNRH